MIKKLQLFLKKANYDAMVIFEGPNLTYVSKFTGDHGALIISKEKAVLLTDPRYISRAKNEAVGVEVVQSERNYLMNLLDLLKSFKKIAFESQFVSFETYMFMNKNLSARLIPVKNVVEQYRLTKSPSEIKILTKGAKIADSALKNVLSKIKKGMKELEVVGLLTNEIRKLGALKESFEVMVLFSENAACPHGQSGNRKLKAGDAILIDFGVVYNGYSTDMTRTFFFQNVKQEYKNLYNIVLKAQLEALSLLKPGRGLSTPDKLVRKIFKQHKLLEYYTHSLGHGVGLCVHEAPALSCMAKGKFKAGMVVTIEPGLYIENKIGIRIEDMVLITKNGCKVLSSFPKELTVINP